MKVLLRLGIIASLAGIGLTEPRALNAAAPPGCQFCSYDANGGYCDTTPRSASASCWEAYYDFSDGSWMSDCVVSGSCGVYYTEDALHGGARSSVRLASASAGSTSGGYLTRNCAGVIVEQRLTPVQAADARSTLATFTL